MRLLTLILLSFCCSRFAYSSTTASDWKYYGSVTLEKTGDVSAFYDAKSIEILENKNVRVWSKGLDTKKMRLELDNKSRNKDYIDSAAKMVVSGYIPPIAAIEDVDRDMRIDIIAMEQVAIKAEVAPTMSILYEIDCAKKMIRELSIMIRLKGEKPNSTRSARDWSYIPPESNGKRLMLLVCKK